jgi:hypothetical protein
VHMRGAAPLELQLPHAGPVLAPRALVALPQRLHVVLQDRAGRNDGLPVAGVGQRDHRREPARGVERRVVQPTDDRGGPLVLFVMPGTGVVRDTTGPLDEDGVWWCTARPLGEAVSRARGTVVRARGITTGAVWFRR